MKLNTKGFTLIEIMITLIISSIVMLVAGTIILNSFGYFDKTETANIDKLAVDKISELVRSELTYASNVVIDSEKPKGDWNALSVNEDGYLLKTTYIEGKVTETQLYNESFYNHRTLNLMARCYNNNGHRVDLSFSFLDRDKEQVYKTSHTLELINMKNNDTSIENTKEDHYSKLLSITGKRTIFYQSGGNVFINDTPTQGGSGTVADEILCKPDDARKFELGEKYKKGEFVSYKGKWYRAIKNVHSLSSLSAPDINFWNEWKLLEPYWSENSSYEIGDVVEYEKDSNQYYQCIKKNIFKVIPTNSKYWKKLTEKEHQAIKEEHDSAVYCKIPSDEITGTVGDEIYCMNSSNTMGWKDYDPYEGLIYYPKGTYIEYRVGSGSYYKAIYAGMNNTIVPGTFGAANSWKKIDKYWNSNSNYEKGDIVFDDKVDKYYQFQIDIGNSTTIPSSSENFAIWKEISKEDAMDKKVCELED